MRKGICLVLLGLLTMVRASVAEIGVIENVPAATLLLPYFECELDASLVPVVGGMTTLFSINNASAAPVLAHVTFWTDESIPTLDFDVYLTGYDVQTINVCDIFRGDLPVTASAGQDPKDTVSPKGPLSQDIDLTSCTGRLPYGNPAIRNVLLSHLRNAHTGGPSTVFGGRCSGFDHPDTIARGYITVDTASQCSLDFPSSPAYFHGIASHQNVLWGDYFYVHPAKSSASGEMLVHIEACLPNNGYIGYAGTGTSGVNTCPLSQPGNYSFYHRYESSPAVNNREALATSFAVRYVNGGLFDGGTDLIVWRDSKTSPGAPGFTNGPHACSAHVSWYPLNQADVVAFDEEENATDLCFQGDNVSPPIGGSATCFPLETQRVRLQGGNTAGADPAPPYLYGWIYLNLNTTVPTGISNPTAQAWVETLMHAS
ncbi:MAG TPA: hypothetical protein VK899_09735, partial [Gemmatimonadales bacterium]|nr:hypothetical protein [Gemmatimonadales bacterium]